MRLQRAQMCGKHSPRANSAHPRRATILDSCRQTLLHGRLRMRHARAGMKRSPHHLCSRTWRHAQLPRNALQRCWGRSVMNRNASTTGCACGHAMHAQTVTAGAAASTLRMTAIPTALGIKRACLRPCSHHTLPCPSDTLCVPVFPPAAPLTTGRPPLTRAAAARRNSASRLVGQITSDSSSAAYAAAQTASPV